jgi:hypothetical protein
MDLRGNLADTPGPFAPHAQDIPAGVIGGLVDE